MRALLVLLLPLLASCGSRPREYNANVKIVRLEIIRKDDQGTPLTTDVEMSFEECPGEQRKTIRGDRSFSECILRHKADEMVPIKIAHHADEHGEMRADITDIAGCFHRNDPNEAASFEVVQVCSDMIVNSVKVGFHCDRKPSKELLDKCPWFRRR
jgi:hypothetical protein